MGHQSGLSFGGSGLSVGLIMQPAFDVASGDIGLSVSFSVCSREAGWLMWKEGDAQ